MINRRADFLPLSDFARWKNKCLPICARSNTISAALFPPLSTSSRQLIVVDFLPPCVARRESAAPLALFLSHPLRTFVTHRCVQNLSPHIKKRIKQRGWKKIPNSLNKRINVIWMNQILISASPAQFPLRPNEFQRVELGLGGSPLAHTL